MYKLQYAITNRYVQSGNWNYLQTNYKVNRLKHPKSTRICTTI